MRHAETACRTGEPRFDSGAEWAETARRWGEPIDGVERRGAIIAVLAVLAAGLAARCGRWDWWVRDRMGLRQDGAEGQMGKDERSPEGAIKLQALKLCTLIADHCPRNGRTEGALSSVRAGVRIALEELSYAQHAGAAAEPKGRGA